MRLVINYPTKRRGEPRKNVETICFVSTNMVGNIFVMVGCEILMLFYIYIYRERLNEIGRKFKRRGMKRTNLFFVRNLILWQIKQVRL